MAILITGASGYVGSHILKELKEEERAECLLPDLDEFELSDYACVDRYFSNHSISHVIHLAACLDNSDHKALFDSNVLGVYNLMMACVKHKIEHIVVVSTNNVYGDGIGRVFSENDACGPMPGNSYGLSKYCSELIVKDYLEHHNVKYAIVRIADVYGPGQKVGTLLKAIVGNIQNQCPQKLFGQGDRTRDYIYIDDVAKGIIHVAKNQLEGIYNLSTGIGTSVVELIRLAERISLCSEPTIYVSVDKEDHSSVVLDNTRLVRSGFKPEVRIEQGLSNLVEFGGNK